MWSNTEKGQLERCDQTQINTRKCDQHRKVQQDVIKYRNGKLERWDQIQIMGN